MSNGSGTQTETTVGDHMCNAGQQVSEQYGREDHPLGGYLAVIGAYSAVLGGLAALGRSRGVRLPKRVPVGDLALMAVATHKVSRTISKDSVTSPVRAPFTKFRGASGPGEVQEEVRGSGVQKALGELITCPFCLDQWVATGFLAGLLAAPRATRWLAATFAVRAGADALQFGYAALQKAAED
ncbi:MAG: DUF1360 domain-containing protein [Actinomycetes bacterium]